MVFPVCVSLSENDIINTDCNRAQFLCPVLTENSSFIL